MKVVGIIQARMGSSRLRGKTMEKIKGKPMIEHLIDRLEKAETLNSIVIATTKIEEDDIVADLAKKKRVGLFRGSETDVLDRYVKASEKFDADIVVRICGDNPLTDPMEIDKLVRNHIKTGADYSYNNIPHLKGLPDGSGAEAISIDVLKKLDKLAKKQSHREHVTLFIHDNLSLFHVEKLDADPGLMRPEFRLDVDYDEDLEFIRKIYDILYEPGKIIKLREVIDLLDRQPDLHNMRKER